MLATLAQSYTRQKIRKSSNHHVEKQVGQALGWISLAIGLTELLAPKSIEKTMGLKEGRHSGLLRVLGVRELLHGADILAHPHDVASGLWGRVAGDILDSVLLACAAKKSKNLGGFLSIAGAVLPGVLADLFLAPKLSAVEE